LEVYIYFNVLSIGVAAFHNFIPEQINRFVDGTMLRSCAGAFWVKLLEKTASHYAPENF